MQPNLLIPTSRYSDFVEISGVCFLDRGDLDCQSSLILDFSPGSHQISSLSEREAYTRAWTRESNQWRWQLNTDSNFGDTIHREIDCAESYDFRKILHWYDCSISMNLCELTLWHPIQTNPIGHPDHQDFCRDYVASYLDIGWNWMHFRKWRVITSIKFQKTI
jgi:hypothetical protein